MSSRATIAKTVLIVVAMAVGFYLLWRLRQVVGALAISAFLAIVLGPAVDWLQRLKLPRGIAILAVYVLILLGVAGAGLLVVPPIVDEGNAFVSTVPGYVNDLRDSQVIRDYDDRYQITDTLLRQAETLPSRLGDALGALQSVTVGVFSALLSLVTILVITLFLLLDGRRIVDFLLRQFGPEHEPLARKVAGEIYTAVGRYAVGAFSIALLGGLATFIVLSILGVPFAVPLAVLTAFLSLIPLVGATIAGAVIAFVTLFQDFPRDLIVWVVFLLVYQQLENHVLQPFVHKRTVALAPLLVIVAVLAGATLLGVLGALLAIPVAAALQILVRNYWAHSKAGSAHPEAAGA